MCFRAWLHDVKLELFNKQKEARVVEKHFNMWKKRIDLNSIATEMVRTKQFYRKFFFKFLDILKQLMLTSRLLHRTLKSLFVPF